MQDLIQDAAELIRPYSADLASQWLAKPFHRKVFARAFESGFRRHTDETRRLCDVIHSIAEADLKARELAATEERLAALEAA